MERLAPEVMGLWLRLPAIEPFDWQAGQYIDVMLAGERRRSFSLANPPHDASLLELHVRRAPGGAFSGQVFNTMKPGALLRIEGPLGQFVHHDGDRPLLASAAARATRRSRRSCAKSWSAARCARSPSTGGRARAELYDDAWLRELAARHPQFRYAPVVTEFVHDAVLREVPGLAGFDVYAAGPPAMIDAVRARCRAQGADPARIFFDSFDWAPA